MTNEEVFKPLIIHCLLNEKTDNYFYGKKESQIMFNLESEKLPNIKRIVIFQRKSFVEVPVVRHSTNFFGFDRYINSVEFEARFSYDIEVTTSDSPDVDYTELYTNIKTKKQYPRCLSFI